MTIIHHHKHTQVVGGVLDNGQLGNHWLGRCAEEKMLLHDSRIMFVMLLLEWGVLLFSS